MIEYELFNEKRAQILSSYSSDKIIERGDIISIGYLDYIVTNLMIPIERKQRLAVWPAKIRIPDDLEDIRLLHWIQQNLKGLRIRLSNNTNTVEGKVTDYWPGIKYMPPVCIKPNEESKVKYIESYPKRLEIISIGPSNPVMLDLTDYMLMEILGNQK